MFDVMLWVCRSLIALLLSPQIILFTLYVCGGWGGGGGGVCFSVCHH